MALAVREFIDGQHAAVAAAGAARGLRRILQLQNVRDGEHGRSLPRPAVTGDQGRAERAHDACDIRAGGLDARDALKGAQHGLIVERAALHDDMAAHVAGIGKLNDLIQRIFDDGVGETSGDILHGRALLLRLLDVGVHEHGAARAQVRGVLCKQGFRRTAPPARKPRRCSRGNWRNFR